MTQALTSTRDWLAIWSAARGRLRRDLGVPVFEAWIGKLSLLDFQQGRTQIRRRRDRSCATGWPTIMSAASKRRCGPKGGIRHPSPSFSLHREAPAVGGGLVSEQSHRSGGHRLLCCPRITRLPAGARTVCAATAARACVTASLHPQRCLRQLHPGPPTSSAMARRAPLPKASRRHSAALHPWRFRLRQDASAERGGAGIRSAASARCSCAPRISCATSWARSIARTRWPSRKSCAPPKC